MPTITALFAQDDLYHLFQPICQLPSRQILGYEALIRSKTIAGTDKLFQAATAQGKLFDLDTLSVYNAIAFYFSTADRRESNEYLFVNIFPSTLIEEAFPVFLDKVVRQYGELSPRIVFEINESRSEMDDWNNRLFTQNINLMRRHGFLIAFDDVGEGATTLKRMIELTPDFVKMDRFFGKNLSSSKKKQKMIKFFVDYCADESNLILEGIEEPEDLLQAHNLGVTLGQGYLLTKPQPLPGTSLTVFCSIED
ncbi:EAL domain-containing protein [Cohnella silvisoli]|uniref:EAL domain-containing protein n=1 Tax=Cohnella silvisoli TaxID=2873699 RepID=A0ABV1KZU0_9BACL|nr:EAL domain-containing protein [Cohnella silvisoli]MCD9024950.1 EAL domain-containing protein [Cohnella silvisoli]